MPHTCTEPSVRGAHGEQGWVTMSISGVSVPSEYPHRSHKKPKGSCLVFYKVGSLPPYCPVRALTVSERVRHSIPARCRYGVSAQVVPGRTGSVKSARAGTFIRADITNGFFPEIAGISLCNVTGCLAFGNVMLCRPRALQVALRLLMQCWPPSSSIAGYGVDGLAPPHAARHPMHSSSTPHPPCNGSRL